MRSTPPLPDWIRDFSHDGYTNIFKLRSEETKLFVTETLFGDWDGSVLLLAKDAAPVHVIEARIDSGEMDPWRHSRKGLDPMGWRTNERVEEIAALLPGAKLYGSALANLMKNGEETSGRLGDFSSGPLREHLGDVLRFVVREMPNLRAIVCLGNDAWDLVTSVYAPPTPEAWPLGEPVPAVDDSRELLLFRLYHPSRAFRGRWVARRKEWRRVADELRGGAG